jgi:hypothetical protein
MDAGADLYMLNNESRTPISFSSDSLKQVLAEHAFNSGVPLHAKAINGSSRTCNMMHSL